MKSRTIVNRIISCLLITMMIVMSSCDISLASDVKNNLTVTAYVNGEKQDLQEINGDIVLNIKPDDDIILKVEPDNADGGEFAFYQIRSGVTEVLQTQGAGNSYEFCVAEEGQHIFGIKVYHEGYETADKRVLVIAESKESVEEKKVEEDSSVSNETESDGSDNNIIQKQKPDDKSDLGPSMQNNMNQRSDFSVLISSSKTTNEYVSRDIELTAKASGGSGGYEYQFEETYAGKTKIVQPYGTNASYAFRTREAGSHTYTVTAKDGSGKTTQAKYSMNVVVHPAMKLSGTVKSSGSSTQYEQRNVTLTADMTAGYGEYQYQFSEVYNGTSKVVQEYGSEPSYKFQTEGVGKHTYYVDVKDLSGQTARMSYVLEVRKYPAVDLGVSLTSNKSTNEYVSRDIELTAKASGGSGGYEYQFEETYAGKTKIVQPYGTNASYAFRTREAGSHTYTVTAKDGSGKTTQAKYSMNVVVHPAMKLSGTVKSSGSSTQYEQRNVTLTADMTAGYGEYQYQFSEVYNGTSKVVQEYGSEPSYKFQTEGVGKHTYYVDVKDLSGQTARMSYVLEVRKYPAADLGVSLTSNKSTNEYVSRDIELTAKASGGSGGYQYQFEETYAGKTKIVQTYGSNTSYAFRTREAGSHTYTVTAKDGSGKTTQAKYSMNVVVHPAMKLSGTVKSGGSSTQYEQRNVTLTADMTAGYGEYQYQFSEVYNGTSKVVQEYGSEPSYKFQTEGVGKHTYYVDVKDLSGQTARMSYVLEVRKYPAVDLGVSLTSNKSTNEYVSRDIELTAKASGGSGGYEYQFEETYAGKTKIVQPYGTNASYAFRTREAGSHTYTVTAKDGSGKTTQAKYSMNVVVHPAMKLSGTVKSSGSSTQYEQRNVTLTADMTAGYGEYQYQFSEVYNGTSKVVQEYGSEPSYKFQTEGVGKHTYYVDVKDLSGQTARMSYVLEVRKYPAADLGVSLTSNKSTKEYVSRDIELMAKASGGSGGYQYQFEETYAGKTDIVQSYSSNAVYAFTTKEIGTHTYTVSVKDSSGNSMKDSYSMTVVIHPSMALNGKLSSNGSTYEYVERSFILTAVAENGYGDYKYQFSEVYDGKETVVQAYSNSPTYSFTTKTIGLHEYYVTIKDSANQTVKIKYAMTVTTHPGKTIQGTFTSNKTDYEYSSRDITLTANATNGYGGYQYQFTRVYNGASKIVQQFSTNNTHSFMTGLPGTYIYYVDIKDSSNAVLRLSYTMTVVSNGTFDGGIDVSSYQGTIDWNKVKQSGVSFTMLRALSGKMNAITVDSSFNANIAGATKNGISVGVYRYGYAMTVAEAQKEAIATVNAIKNSGYSITYPVAYDVEDSATQGTLSKNQLTDIIKAYRGVIENNGYKFMIYSSKSWFDSKIDMKEFAGEDLWVASWFSDGTPYHDHGYTGPGNVTIWQYSSTGRVPGISGNVDMNVGYAKY